MFAATPTPEHVPQATNLAGEQKKEAETGSKQVVPDTKLSSPNTKGKSQGSKVNDRRGIQTEKKQSELKSSSSKVKLPQQLIRIPKRLSSATSTSSIPQSHHGRQTGGKTREPVKPSPLNMKKAQSNVDVSISSHRPRHTMPKQQSQPRMRTVTAAVNTRNTSKISTPKTSRKGSQDEPKSPSKLSASMDSGSGKAPGRGLAVKKMEQSTSSLGSPPGSSGADLEQDSAESGVDTLSPPHDRLSLSGDIDGEVSTINT